MIFYRKGVCGIMKQIVKNKKVYVFLVMLAFVMTTLSLMAFAANEASNLSAVCKIDGIEYASLPQAVIEAAEGDEIILLSNTELAETLVIDKKITLNIGEFTLSSAVTKGSVVKIAEDVTIKGSGSIRSADRISSGPTGTANVILVNSGKKLTLEGVTIQPGLTQTSGMTSSATIGIETLGGTVVLKDATIYGGNSEGAGKGGTAVSISHSGTLTAENCNFYGGEFIRTSKTNNAGGIGLYIANSSTADLINCKAYGGDGFSALDDYYYANGGNAVQIQTEGTLTISGGEFIGGADKQQVKGAEGGKAICTEGGGSKADVTVQNAVISGGKSENGTGGNAICFVGPSQIEIDGSQIKGGNGGKEAGTAVNLGSTSVEGNLTIKDSNIKGGEGPVDYDSGAAVKFGRMYSDDAVIKHISTMLDHCVIGVSEGAPVIYGGQKEIEGGKLILNNMSLDGDITILAAAGGYLYELTPEQVSRMAPENILSGKAIKADGSVSYKFGEDSVIDFAQNAADHEKIEIMGGTCTNESGMVPENKEITVARIEKSDADAPIVYLYGKETVEEEATKTESGDIISVLQGDAALDAPNGVTVKNDDTNTGNVTIGGAEVLAGAEKTAAHSLTKVEATSATDAADGNIEHWVCDHCDYKFADSAGSKFIDDVTVHNLVKVDQVNATCDNAGVKEHYKCTNCGKLFSDADGKIPVTTEELNISATGHWLSRKAKATEADCDNPGNIEYWQCNRCNHFFADSAGATELKDGEWVIPQHPHRVTTVVTEPTCTESGLEETRCADCNELLSSRELEISEHDFATEWKTNEDNHWHECAVCGEKTDAAEHTFKWVIDKEATETETGSKHEECEICGHKLAAVEIPKTEIPQTGDRSMALWIMLLTLAGTVLAGGTLYFRKRKA